ncbi:RNase P subunit p30-domain-containing protein [Crassisporium funariophilum]|nr:RNase P subunit p30-domain-containing protein [Crassisporium funariophilum]
MFFDLNFPVQRISSLQTASKKGKQPQQAEAVPTFLPSQISAIEARVDLLIHLGYSVIAFSQTLNKKIDPKTHVNFLDGLLVQLRSRSGIVYLKRLNIILDRDSEKGFGLINANLSLFNSYDLIALIPTTHTTFSLACLTHSLPSPLTAHIIALPLTLPRLPYHLKHTLVRTAIKNGAVFEINYVGSLGGENDATLADANAAESGSSAKRNWWAATRELVRVTKGKGLIISGGVVAEADLRAPRDVANLIAILGLAQDAAHEASTKAPRSLVVRAQTRKTYRAVLSEPTLVVPFDHTHSTLESSQVAPESTANAMSAKSSLDNSIPQKRLRDMSGTVLDEVASTVPGLSQKKKRKRDQKADKLVT